MKLKPLTYIFALLLFFSSCNNESSSVLEKWDDNSIKKEKVWIDRKANSFKEIEYYKNGQIKVDEEFKNGLPNIFKAFYDTGELSALFMYHYGEPVIGAEYYKNGQVMGSVPRKLDGKINGIATYYYENGNLRSEVEYINDKSTGFSKEYDVNGKLTYDSRAELKQTNEK